MNKGKMRNVTIFEKLIQTKTNKKAQQNHLMTDSVKHGSYYPVILFSDPL